MWRDRHLLRLITYALVGPVMVLGVFKLTDLWVERDCPGECELSYIPSFYAGLIAAIVLAAIVLVCEGRCAVLRRRG